MRICEDFRSAGGCARGARCRLLHLPHDPPASVLSLAGASELPLTAPGELLMRTEQQADVETDPARCVALRRECLALAQIACIDDAYQLGRASHKLAQAYVIARAHEPAARHAERAEALLASEPDRKEAVHLLPEAALVLASALAGLGRRRAATDAYKRAAALATGETRLQVLHGCARLAASDGDYARAVELLEKERELRRARSGALPTPAERDAEIELCIQIADTLLREARAKLGKAAGGAKAAESADATCQIVVEVRVEAARLRNRAVRLLLPFFAADEDGATGVDAADVAPAPADADGEPAPRLVECARSALEARLALKCAEAHRELERWDCVEADTWRALLWHEEVDGLCHAETTRLWAQARRPCMIITNGS